MFDSTYKSEMQISDPQNYEDFVSLRNAISLIYELKKDGVYREVYMVTDSICRFC